VTKARGIVLESNNGYSTILMEGGQYIKIHRTLEVGQIYQQENRYQKFLLAAAAVLIFLLLATADFFNVVAYANVSNGIEIGVNRWNRIIKVEQTGTAQALPAEYEALKGQKLEEAVPIVVKEAFTVNEDQSEITIRVKSEKKDGSRLEEKLIEKIESSVEEDFNIHKKSNEKVDDKNKNSIKIKLMNDQLEREDVSSSNNQIKPVPVIEEDNDDYQATPDNEKNKSDNQSSSIKKSSSNSESDNLENKGKRN